MTMTEYTVSVEATRYVPLEVEDDTLGSLRAAVRDLEKREHVTVKHVFKDGVRMSVLGPDDRRVEVF